MHTSLGYFRNSIGFPGQSVLFSSPLGLLFSATMKKKVEWLCRDILTDPIRIVVGEIGEVSFLVTFNQQG